MKYSLHRLGDLENSQMETALLHSCLSLPKVTHLLRTCPPDVIQSALVKFDEIMRDAASDLAGCALSDWAWLKSSLPSSLGSLNIRHATLYALAAFVGSIHQSESRVSDILGHPVKAPLHLPYAINALAKSVARPDWISVESIDVPLRSHSFSHSIDDACFSFLVESSPDIRSKALALSSALPHAGNWLNVVPCSALGLHLMDCVFRLCLKYWLGLQMFEDGDRCPVCHVVADPFGDHLVGCGGNADRIARHNALRDAIFSAAQSAALAPRREVSSLIPSSLNRPADVYLPNLKGGRPAALDVTVISTMQQATIQGAAISQGHALLVGEERKLAADVDACQAVGVSFIPLVVGTLVGMSASSVSTLACLGRLLGQRLGIPPAEYIRHLFQRCTISLWRGNAALWIQRIPTLAPFVDGIR